MRGCPKCEPFTPTFFTCKVVGCKNGPPAPKPAAPDWGSLGLPVPTRHFDIGLSTLTFIAKGFLLKDPNAMCVVAIIEPAVGGTTHRIKAERGFEISWLPDSNHPWHDWLLVTKPQDPNKVYPLYWMLL